LSRPRPRPRTKFRPRGQSGLEDLTSLDGCRITIDSTRLALRAVARNNVKSGAMPRTRSDHKIDSKSLEDFAKKINTRYRPEQSKQSQNILAGGPKK